MKRKPQYVKHGRTPRSANARLKTNDEPRVCEIFGCTTQLSRYNTSDRCWPHRERRAPRLRGMTEEERLAKLPQCQICGELAYEDDSPRPVEIDGMLHLEGTDGYGALCEAFLE